MWRLHIWLWALLLAFAALVLTWSLPAFASVTCAVRRHGQFVCTYYCRDGFICDTANNRCNPGQELKHKTSEAEEKARRSTLANNRTRARREALSGDPRDMPSPHHEIGSYTPRPVSTGAAEPTTGFIASRNAAATPSPPAPPQQSSNYSSAPPSQGHETQSLGKRLTRDATSNGIAAPPTQKSNPPQLIAKGMTILAPQHSAGTARYTATGTCSTITGPGMTGGGPANCGNSGNFNATGASQPAPQPPGRPTMNRSVPPQRLTLRKRLTYTLMIGRLFDYRNSFPIGSAERNSIDDRLRALDQQLLEQGVDLQNDFSDPELYRDPERASGDPFIAAGKYCQQDIADPQITICWQMASTGYCKKWRTGTDGRTLPSDYDPHDTESFSDDVVNANIYTQPCPPQAADAFQNALKSHADEPSAPPPASEANDDSGDDDPFCAFIARRAVRGELKAGGGDNIPDNCRKALDAAKSCAEQKCSMADIIDRQERDSVTDRMPWGAEDYQAIQKYTGN